MEYRKIGKSGLKVSELALGTMMFGGQTVEATSARIIAKARDQGVNHIDTADVYNRGAAEEIVGRAVKGERDKWVIGTKVNAPMLDNPNPNERGLSRKYIFQEVEASLRRLQTDYIDIYYPHREDPDTPIEETLRALVDLVREGKILHYAISNHQSWKLAEYIRLADLIGAPRPIGTQLCYNITDRRPEKEHFHITEYYGLGNVAYSVLARGVLTGKYEPGVPPPPGTRAGRNDPKMKVTEWRPESIDFAAALKDYAATRGVTPAEFAFAWALANRSVSSAIAGPRTEEQWDSYITALAFRLTDEDEDFVNRHVKSGYASTHGHSDPADTKPLRKLA